MAATKKTVAPSNIAAWLHWLALPRNRGLVATLLVAVAAIGAFIYSWHRWGAVATGSPDYVVTPELIDISPQPAWIHGSIKADVVRTAGVKRLDLRDAKLLEHLASAFALHPWVAKVVRIEKQFPARVHVQLKYRQPVAVVEIAPQGQHGLLFIDEESVLLPSDDFGPDQAKDYLRIAGEAETTPSVYGTRWGSDRIAGAARVAVAFGKRWKPLELYRIVAAQTRDGRLEYELRTQKGARIIWGGMPGNETQAEPSAEQKIAALEQFVRNKGPLDRDGSQSLIDLRQLAAAHDQTAGRQKDQPH
jgi:hypothetical protein